MQAVQAFPGMTGVAPQVHIVPGMLPPGLAPPGLPPGLTHVTLAHAPTAHHHAPMAVHAQAVAPAPAPMPGAVGGATCKAGGPVIGPTMPPHSAPVPGVSAGEAPSFDPGTPEAAFVQQNAFDSGALAAFKALREDIRRQVMAEGPVTGNNPSAMLVARIKKVESSLNAVPNNAVSVFCQENRLDLSAEHALRALTPEVASRVMSEGPLLGSNPSAVLMSRIHKAREGLQP